MVVSGPAMGGGTGGAGMAAGGGAFSAYWDSIVSFESSSDDDDLGDDDGGKLSLWCVVLHVVFRVAKPPFSSTYCLLGDGKHAKIKDISDFDIKAPEGVAFETLEDGSTALLLKPGENIT